MNAIEIILTLIMGTMYIRNTLSYALLWWVKEYRFDRMRIHLRTKQGHRVWWPPFRLPRRSPKAIVMISMNLLVAGVCLSLLPDKPYLALLLLIISLFPLSWVFVFMVT